MNVEERIPILSDMPLIGGLFSSRRKELTDSELVLLLQPTIVSASEPVYEPVLAEKGEILMPEGTQEDKNCNRTEQNRNNTGLGKFDELLLFC